MRVFLRYVLCVAVGSMLAGGVGAGDFRVRPYLQNPASDAMSVRWLSNTSDPGTLKLEGDAREFRSTPVLATALAYNTLSPEPGGPHPELPWLHQVRLTGLAPGGKYTYTVTQGAETHTGTFTTPAPDQPVRFVVYSDSETEPESSTTPPVAWPIPKNSNRPAGQPDYFVNQTVGYQENCRVIAERKPNFVLVVGDIVETGGEQRDWDEFWKHNAGEFNTLAGDIPILTALGNHENSAGPGGGYDAAASNFSTDKFLTYFESPSNEATNPKHHGRYYRIDYGPVTIITVDSSNGNPHKTDADTNHYLDGSNAPDFNPGSEQYQWLEAQLADAQAKSRFTFVDFHHTMYGSGPHSVPFGRKGFSGQSGIAMRVLRPLLFRYGVDAVFSGHDELMERSEETGTERLADGTDRPQTIHFYDVGIGGDGLRGPSSGADNSFRKFLAHDDAPEVWKGKQLVSGGKHYGHLEVNVAPDANGVWQVELTPVHVFPLNDSNGKVTGWERRTYPDTVKFAQP